MNRRTSHSFLRGPACGALFAVLCAPSAWAYMSSEAGQPSQEVTTINELMENGQKDVAKAVESDFKKNGGKTAEQMQQEFAEQQAREAERKAAEAAREAEKAPARKPALEAFDPQGNRKPPLEELLGDAKEKPAPAQEGKSALGQLKQSAGGGSSGDVPTVDGGGAVASAPPVTGAPEKEKPQDDTARMKAFIPKMCEKKSEDERAKALCNKYFNDVVGLGTSFGGWLGKIQKAVKDDLKNGNMSNFPKIKFGDVPAGAAATWSGDPNGGDEPIITMATFLDTTSKATMKIADHEYRHHADAKHWDGSQLGQNPKQDVEPPCYATMGCLNSGECDEKL